MNTKNCKSTNIEITKLKLNNKAKAFILGGVAVVAILLGIGVGSVFIPPKDIVRILGGYLFKIEMPDTIEPIMYSLVTGIRLPRVIMAFLTGAALSISGTVMQSVLKNPLASPYGLGVSSGAGLGAAIIMISGLSSGYLGIFLLPGVGMLFGLCAVLIAVIFAQRIDRNLSSNTIVLSGMVISLFLSAVLNMLASANPQFTHQILLWQLGTFQGKEWSQIGLLAIVIIICFVLFMVKNKELDIMTFGDDQAVGMGINIRRVRWMLIIVTALLTSTAVSFVGIIGFVDLIAPHVVRRFYGASHKWVIPMSALFGGAFMVICDLAGRTIASPSEIPVGSITALIGAPFFVYIFFISRRKA